ncbi:uncharacterized protein LOC124939775 [Impatiens glandulifera]|uniref:uncharacterized protein LOC124939775 n=1 Tax=Impatiens glandulifera TaxID=253017 RepID=UPI001FB0842F|nr:uncharacterized protein LOC124939775 [Impatiens glandulifera]
MPTVWFSLKRSLHCKSEPSEVHDPKTKNHLSALLTRKVGRSGCSRSIANLKDVIHGSKRHMEKPPSCSPRSIGSGEFINPIAHEVILSNSKCELKITGFGGFHDGISPSSGGGAAAGGWNLNRDSTFVGTLTPGTPGPGGHHHHNPLMNRRRKSSEDGAGSRGIRSSSRANNNNNAEIDGHSGSVTCHKCGEQFGKWDALESHHLSKHAVTELVEGDSSRKIVEIICRANWLKTENNSIRIERVLKVHNMQRTLARFEEHRETVKIKASKLPKKHPRCIADGNELLRFYGTTLTCSLGINGSSSLCSSDKCCVCRIVRNGFSTKKEVKGGIGVFTTSTSGRAFECIENGHGENNNGNGIQSSMMMTMMRKALIVCRVIAGRVHKPLENIQEMAGQTGFDSLAGKIGLYSNIEELYLLNPKALLPCFVVICKS